MIGSPAARGAAASTGAPGRACLAAAPAVSAVRAIIAASVTMAGGPQRRIAMVDCAVVNRLTMLSPVETSLRLRRSSVRSRFWNSRHHLRQFAPAPIGTFRRRISQYDSLHRKKDGSRPKLGTKRTWRYVELLSPASDHQ